MLVVEFFSGFLVTFTLGLVLFSLGYFLGMKISLDREMESPFECGFTPKFSARLPFSVRFFLIALVFLIFDVELVLMFPVVPAVKGSYLVGTEFIFFLAVVILLVGLLHEVFQGSLTWAS